MLLRNMVVVLLGVVVGVVGVVAGGHSHKALGPVAVAMLLHSSVVVGVLGVMLEVLEYSQAELLANSHRHSHTGSQLGHSHSRRQAGMLAHKHSHRHSHTGSHMDHSH